MLIVPVKRVLLLFSKSDVSGDMFDARNDLSQKKKITEYTGQPIHKVVKISEHFEKKTRKFVKNQTTLKM